MKYALHKKGEFRSIKFHADWRQVSISTLKQVNEFKRRSRNLKERYVQRFSLTNFFYSLLMYDQTFALLCLNRRHRFNEGFIFLLTRYCKLTRDSIKLKIGKVQCRLPRKWLTVFNERTSCNLYLTRIKPFLTST